MQHRALFLALLATSLTAGAADVGQHPAIFTPRSLPGIDASTFIVGHPAGGAPGQAEPQAAQPRNQARSVPGPGGASPSRDQALRTSSR